MITERDESNGGTRVHVREMDLLWAEIKGIKEAQGRIVLLLFGNLIGIIVLLASMLAPHLAQSAAGSYLGYLLATVSSF